MVFLMYGAVLLIVFIAVAGAAVNDARVVSAVANSKSE